MIFHRLTEHSQTRPRIPYPWSLPDFIGTLTVALLALYLTGCGTIQNIFTLEEVRPWEKDILAQKTMQIPPDDMFSYSDDHIYFSKEASTGGKGVGGGGCGCN